MSPQPATFPHSPAINLQRRGRSRRSPWLASLAAGALVAGAVGCSGSSDTQTSGTSGSTAPSGSATCTDPVAVQVSVTPDIRDVVQAQAEAVGPAACATYTVVAEAPGVVANRAPGTQGTPDIWIPDSPLWPLRVNQTKPGTYTIPGQAIATSPVTLAVPKALVDGGKVPTGQIPMSQQIAGAAPALAVAAPAESSATMTILLTAWHNSGQSPSARILAGTTFLKVANSTATDEQLFARAVPGNAEGPAVFPASEHGMHAFNAAHPDAQLTSLGAVEGLGGLKYIAAVPANLDQTKTAAVGALKARLRSTEAAEAFRAAGLRVDGRGTVTVPGLPAEVKIEMDTPSAALLQEVTAKMARLASKVRMLMVVDTSGSMLDPSGYGMSRIELTAKAVVTALNFIPPNTEGGLWQMANNLTWGAHDWREITPIQPLSGPEGELLPAALALSNGFDALMPTVRGGTGLYDTTWDAYRAMAAVATKDANNLVVLLTDGRNEDDPGSISLQQLVTKLNGAHTPDKPVRVVLAGMGPQSDMAALRTIASATGGVAQLVDTQTTMIDVIVGALIS